ncbi:major urinary protein 20-like [Mus pahari]|uniref:major urinary protein 20-like n=1 Tax=Mus pahari TaxID=10093 RepID=UPI000A312879|nr:major urinary protein 20-like [Mus pahari]
MELLLLLCLGLTLVCVRAEEASSMSRNFNVEKINGKWYSLLLASNKTEEVEEHGSMRVFVEDIHVLENSLAFKFHTVKHEECIELFLVAYKTKKAGEYSMEYNGLNTFTILETDYDNYLMFHLINTNNGKTFQVMGLYGRKPDLSSDIKKRFLKGRYKHGIVEDKVINLTKANRCLEARE